MLIFCVFSRSPGTPDLLHSWDNFVYLEYLGYLLFDIVTSSYFDEDGLVYPILSSNCDTLLQARSSLLPQTIQVTKHETETDIKTRPRNDSENQPPQSAGQKQHDQYCNHYQKLSKTTWAAHDLGAAHNLEKTNIRSLQVVIINLKFGLCISLKFFCKCLLFPANMHFDNVANLGPHPAPT